MPEPFGSFGWICSHTPLPQCNLFFAQLYNHNTQLTTLFPTSSSFFSEYNVTSASVTGDTNVMAARSQAGNGVGANCEIARAGQLGSDGDIALVVFSVLSVAITLGQSYWASKRRAAVGRVELHLLLSAYALYSVLQAVTMSSMLEQGSDALIILSSIYNAVFATFFWLLLGHAIVATQVVEDGTPAALVPLILLSVLFFLPALYVSLSTGYNESTVFRVSSSDPEDLNNIALFVITLIWPALALTLYFGIMLYITLGMLREIKPAFYVICSGVFLGAGKLIFFLGSQPLCTVSNGKVNGAFITTILDAGAMGMVYLTWHTITEGEWVEDGYNLP